MYETEDCVSALKEMTDNYVRMAEICLRICDKEEARAYINKALYYAQKHDSIEYGIKPKAILCGCEKYGYSVMQSGKLAHPYGKLEESIVSLMKSQTIFKDIIIEIEN